jgi:hypothetical protein
MRLAFASLFVSFVSVIVTIFVQQNIIGDQHFELSVCDARIDRCEERLKQIDCDAPLIAGAPFGGLGLYRAVNCGQHKPVSADINCRHTDQHSCECEWTERQ